MPNQIKMKIGLPTDVPNMGPIEGLGSPNKLTAYQLKNWIKKSALDNKIKERLVKKIDSYPSNTMLHFYKNILTHISNIQKEINNETLHSDQDSQTN